jgi:hypothetical protein
MISKLYCDNAEGHLDDARLYKMVDDLERESASLNALLEQLETVDIAQQTKDRYDRFFARAREYTQLDTLDRATLVTFVDRIEVGPKILPEGTIAATHRNQAYRQNVRIFYRFLGDLEAEQIRDFPLQVDTNQVEDHSLNEGDLPSEQLNPA